MSLPVVHGGAFLPVRVIPIPSAAAGDEALLDAVAAALERAKSPVRARTPGAVEFAGPDPARGAWKEAQRTRHSVSAGRVSVRGAGADRALVVRLELDSFRLLGMPSLIGGVVALIGMPLALRGLFLAILAFGAWEAWRDARSAYDDLLRDAALGAK